MPRHKKFLNLQEIQNILIINRIPRWYQGRRKPPAKLFEVTSGCLVLMPERRDFPSIGAINDGPFPDKPVHAAFPVVFPIRVHDC